MSRINGQDVRAASEKALIFEESFIPRVSTPVDTSTAQGRADAIASETLAGYNPPARINSQSLGRDAATFQSKDFPVPPRCPLSRRSRRGMLPLSRTLPTFYIVSDTII